MVEIGLAKTDTKRSREKQLLGAARYWHRRGDVVNAVHYFGNFLSFAYDGKAPATRHKMQTTKVWAIRYYLSLGQGGAQSEGERLAKEILAKYDGVYGVHKSWYQRELEHIAKEAIFSKVFSQTEIDKLADIYKKWRNPEGEKNIRAFLDFLEGEVEELAFRGR